MIKIVDKVWGNEECLVNNEIYCAKFLNLKEGYECSLHFHNTKDETFYILDGEIILHTVDLHPFIERHSFEFKTFEEDLKPYTQHFLSLSEKTFLKKGDRFRLKPLVAHKFQSLTHTSKILEISTTHFEEDTYRLTKAGKINETKKLSC